MECSVCGSNLLPIDVNPELSYCPKCAHYLAKNIYEENIRQQSHYTQHKIQPVCFIGENKLDFLAGNVIKYVSRYNLKNGVEDLKKARHYLDMLIQRESGEPITP